MSDPIRQFTKPALTPDQLLEHLKRRGLTIGDEPAARHALELIGYYRLLIYMRPLQHPDKTFKTGSTFQDIIDLYDFDRKLRLLCLDAIERVEVALRAVIINTLSVSHGPHFYMESRHFEKLSGFKDFLKTATDAKYLAIYHYYENHNTPSLPPIWAITEALTFGRLSRLYADLKLIHRKEMARKWGLDEKILTSWFRSINTLRNMCAHHNRLWNFHLHVNEPMRAKAYADDLAQRNSFYSRAVVLLVLMETIAPKSNWRNNLIALIDEYPNVSPVAMGFPSDWRERPLWKN